MIYLDNAASTAMDYRVADAMDVSGAFANPSSIHRAGRTAKRKISEARAQFAELLNCNDDQIIFTSGGSESNAMVLRGYKPLYEDRANKVAYSAVEHDSVSENAIRFPAGIWANPVVIPVSKYGTVNIDKLCEILEDRTVKLVSVMAANNEIPSTNCIPDIAQICHEYGAALHTDCVQAVGSIDLDVRIMDADFVSLSAHKFYGPKGVGVLYCKDKSTLYPLVSGSGSQEFGLKCGTENVRGIVGAGKAAELIRLEAEADSDRICRIKLHFYDQLSKNLKKLGLADVLHTNGFAPASMLVAGASGKILSLTFDGVDAQSLVLALSAKDVFISAGSACNSDSTVGSHVLKAIGLTEKQAHSTVRISFSKYDSIETATRAAGIIAETVSALKSIGGVWRE